VKLAVRLPIDSGMGELRRRRAITTAPRGPREAKRPAALALRRAGMLAGVLLGLGASSASAAGLAMLATDPADQAAPGLDLLKAEIRQDTVSGSITAHVELAGASDPLNPTVVRIVLGNTAPNGTCVALRGAEFVTLMRLDTSAVAWNVGTGLYTKWADGTGTVNGAALDLAVETDGRLRTKIGTCAAISTGTTSGWPDPFFDEVDGVFAKAELAPTVVNGQTASSSTGDRDLDGVADITDRCPADPGLRADGCPDAPGGLSLRLGARRLVVVRLMAKVDGVTTCPAVTKVVVSQNRRLGAAKLSTTAQGKLCEVKGVVRLKRHRKNSAVRVVITGNGLSSVVQRIAT
jgi:hypothetical protein